MKPKEITTTINSIYESLEDCYKMIVELKASLPDELDDTEIVTILSNVEDSMLSIESFQTNELEDFYDGKTVFDYEE